MTYVPHIIPKRCFKVLFQICICYGLLVVCSTNNAVITFAVTYLCPVSLSRNVLLELSFSYNYYSGRWQPLWSNYEKRTYKLILQIAKGSFSPVVFYTKEVKLRADSCDQCFLFHLAVGAFLLSAGRVKRNVILC